MIRNNLSILLSERGMKNTALSIKTGISKNTISSLTQNDGKMIQLETINKICQVLDIDPGQFFSYIPYDFEFVFSFEGIEPNFRMDDMYEISAFYFEKFEFDFFIKVLKGNTEIALYEFQPTTMGLCQNLFKINNKLNISFLIFENYNEFKGLWDNIPLSFKLDITNNIKRNFFNDLTSYLENYLNVDLEDSPLSDEDKEVIIRSLQEMVEIDFNPFLPDPFNTDFFTD